MKALSLKYSNPVLSQIQGCAIFLRYWVKLLIFPITYARYVQKLCILTNIVNLYSVDHGALTSYQSFYGLRGWLLVKKA